MERCSHRFQRGISRLLQPDSNSGTARDSNLVIILGYVPQMATVNIMREIILSIVTSGRREYDTELTKP